MESPSVAKPAEVNRGNLMAGLITDSDAESDANLEKRQATAFQPVRDQQHEIIYNKYLPYSDKLEAEAALWVEDIKLNLSKCVLAGDYRPGVFFWTTRLDSYISLYGRQFSKEDHTNFIKLYFELMLHPGMDPNLIQRWCRMINTLMRKLELIAPDSLSVEWKPIFKLYDLIEMSKDQFHGVLYWPDKMEEDMRELIGYCRYYFPLSATQEMLDEFRPMFCPFDDSMARAMGYLSMFLPTMLKPTEAEHGYKLWLDEFLRLWLGFHGVPSWEAPMLQLFSRVAAENIGYIPWDNYVSSIFTKFLRTLELPVGKKQLQLVYSNESFDDSSAVLWPVAMMHSEACMVALERVFKSVESYFHPSNYGNWTDKLSSTLMFIPSGLVARLQLERFRPRDWMPDIPAEACLTDAQIRRFVRAFKPLAFLNLFSRAAADEAVEAIKNMALMAPDEIFPDLLEKFYASVETLTEPLRFQAIVSALSASLPYLFSYKEGKKNVVPLMLAMLPGIDSNDSRKTMAALGFFSTISVMVPLRPCFNVGEDLSEADQEICGTSAEFEDILVQLLDRCLSIIDTFTVDSGARTHETKQTGTDMSLEEKMIKIRMDLLWITVFTQTDDKTAEILLEKLYKTASTNIYPVQQVGSIATSSMCVLATRVRPDLAKPLLFHRLLKLLELSLDERPGIIEMSNADDEFLWRLKIVGDVAAVTGRHILEFIPRLKSVLTRTLLMQCPVGHRLAAVLSRSIITTLLRTYPINYYDPQFYVLPTGASPLEQWGKLVYPADVKVEWHVPDDEIISLCSAFFEEFIADPLEALDQYAKGTLAIDDKKVQKHLHIIEALFTAISSHCGFDFEEAIPLEGADFAYPKADLPIIAREQREILLQGQPVRTVLAELLHRVADRIVNGLQDETKSLKSVLVVYKAVAMLRGPSAEDVVGHAQALSLVKKELDNRLGPKKHRFRLLFIEKARLQHEVRTVFQKASRVTKNRLNILRYVVRLAVSRYKEVRSVAQTCFSSIVAMLQLSYRYILDDILAYLAASKDKPDSDNDAQLKGCLFLLLGGKNLAYLLKHDWDTLRKVFPAVVRAQHSDNPTVSHVFDALSDTIETKFVTTGLTATSSVPANKVAGAILGTMDLELEVIFEHALTFGMKKMEERNARNRALYVDMVNELVTLLSTPQIRLKNFVIGHVFLSYFIRNDILPPLSVVAFTVERLLDSNDKTRRSSILMMTSILRSIKPTRKRIRINPCHDLIGTPLPAPTTVGMREDNLWICFNESTVPATEEAYDNTVFIDKMWPGYYGWPKDGLEVHAPISQQVAPENARPDTVDLETAILSRFTNEPFMDALMKFWSAEDFAHEAFDSENFLVLRGLFRHFRDKIVPLFLKHTRVWVKSREEHHQRAAAEVLTALIRGSKRWPFKMVIALRQEIIPIIQTALNNITGETQGDWVAFATNSIGDGDMRRSFPLLNSVMSVSPNDTGFQTTSKLAVIHGAFECSDWRRRDLHYKVLELIESRLTDSYRDHSAYLLSVCFRHDLNIPNMETRVDQGPKATDFFLKYYSRCLTLMQQDGTRLTTLGLLNLFKTVVKTIVTHVSSLACLRPDVLQYYPLLCRFENDPRDGDLAKDCISALTCFSQVFLSENAITRLLQEVRAVVLDSANMPWRGRVVALDNLQVCVFNNLLPIMENPRWVGEIAQLIQDRLLDEQIEVRQMAAVTLTGFIQCDFIPMSQAFIRGFRQLATSVLPQDRSSAEYTQSVVKRHAGVLGLSACIAAHPYEVPPVIPDILMDLGEHINDPPPISQSVRATFSEFRRTHHDSWREHKEKFSDDQLAVLTDLLVSPNYYA
ncbi:Proteasome activator complex subunit 4 [Hypsibius exemplaris]|uniref:Proteasome activator complex subunit 4 n=1 Tax=Hypsibius exemplaris TaxID=2072580 RepID=A0A1W0WSN0_HYPEX|nr:Proteasome activator complex subunit 4 [Hypsibius exemplaris]